jgi:uncharacterized protein (DUF2062 family)
MFSRIFSKLNAMISRALHQGWSAEKVCWSCAWGCSIGIFPILGFTMAALALIGMAFKLNHTVLQGFNYLVSPLKWALILPSVRLGEWILQSENPFRLSLGEFSDRFRAAPAATVAEFGMTFVHAIVGWIFVAPFMLFFVYVLMRYLLRVTSARRNSLEEVPT